MEYLNRGEKEKKHRLIILTDMENELDDSQTMVRLLMYANEVDIEGLITVTSRWLQVDHYPESIEDRVKAYGVVRDNLCLHGDGWPTCEELLAKITTGQRGYGMKAVGEGQSTPGSEMITGILDKEDDRPVWFAINAGANTLAQAVWDVKHSRTPEEFEQFMSKIRVYDDSGQDDAGAWICREFPQMFYIRSRYQVFGLYGPDFNSGPQPWEGPVIWKDNNSPTCLSEQPMTQWKWAEINIRRRHGLLGAMYPQRVHGEGTSYGFMDGGGSTCLMGLVNKGLFEPEKITWGGWGGRFSWEKEQVFAGQKDVPPLEEKFIPFSMYPEATDTWRDGDVLYENDIYAPVFRWREAYTNDFKARMDWCVTPYEKANHHPRAVFMGDDNRSVVRLSADAGEIIPLDASGSNDPDGDGLFFDWSYYPEPGSYDGIIRIDEPQSAVTSVLIPHDASGKQIHIILKVTDDNEEASLSSYRRLVININ